MTARKKLARWLIGGAAAMAITAGVGGDASAQVKKTLVLGSTNSTSSHYAIAVAMSKAIKESMPDATITVIETGASHDNMRRMTRGEVDFGLSGSDATVLATDGLGPYKDRPIKDVVVLYAYDRTALNVAVRADSGVTKLADLDGKKFNPGIHGSAAESLSRQVFTLLDIKPDWAPGTLKDAVEGIQNRQLVGYSKYASVDVPDATLRELLVSTPMRLLDFTAADQARIQPNVRGVGFVTLKDNVIPGQGSVTIPGIQTTYVTLQSKMNDDTAYAIAKAIYEQRKFLIEVFPHLKDFDFKKESLRTETIGLTLHPGAKKVCTALKVSSN